MFLRLNDFYFHLEITFLSLGKRQSGRKPQNTVGLLAFFTTKRGNQDWSEKLLEVEASDNNAAKQQERKVS